MVQQLSLYGSLPDNERQMMLHTLSALTGMPGRELDETVLVWEPSLPFKPTLAAGEVNQIEQYRIFTKTRSSNVPEYSADNMDKLRSLDWTLEVQEVPEAGRGLKVLFQQVFESKIAKGDIFNTLNNLGYKFRRQYWVRGYEFVQNNTIFHVFRVWKVDEPGSEPALLDASGDWTAKAWVSIRSVTDLAAIEMATTELEAFQSDLRGLFSLEAPPRNAFDTRVR